MAQEMCTSSERPRCALCVPDVVSVVLLCVCVCVCARARKSRNICNKIVASWPARASRPDSSITLSIRRVNQSSFSEVQGARRVNNGARDGGG